LVYIAFGASRSELDASRRIAQLLADNSIEVRLVLFPFGLDSNGFASRCPRREQINCWPQGNLKEELK